MVVKMDLWTVGMRADKMEVHSVAQSVAALEYSMAVMLAQLDATTAAYSDRW